MSLDRVVFPESIENLSKKVKEYDARVDKDVEYDVVSQFNQKLLFQICLPSSAMYDDGIDIDVLCKCIFRPDEWWSNRQLLVDALTSFGKVKGFKPTIKHNAIRCNRYGEKEYIRNYRGAGLQVACNFSLNVKTMYNSTVANTKTNKTKSKPNYSQPCKIVLNQGTKRSTNSCWDHGGLCEPSSMNLINARQRSGDYIGTIGSSAIFTLCKMAKQKTLTNGSIRSIIQPMLPSQKLMDRKEFFYLRSKIEKALPHYEAHPEYEAFSELMDDKDILDGLDNEFEIGDDEAMKLATDLWLEVLRDSDDRSDAIISMRQYMELISKHANGFVYSFALDDKQNANGLVWMTATMRRNIELYGFYWALDAMARRLNTWNWPYMSICFYNEHKKMCVGCEAMMCGERKDAYAFMIKFVLANVPLRTACSVLIFSGDGFFTQAMVIQFGFINGRYLRDWFHLFDSGLVDIFGEVPLTLLKGDLVQMIRADSEDHFDKAYSNAQLTLLQQPSRDGDLEAKLHKFASENAEYSQYQIDKMPGSRGLHGSSVSEQNHSSTLCHLNDGRSKDNEYCEAPITYVKDLFGRQQKLISKMNSVLYDAKLQICIERENIQQDVDSWRKIQLLKALDCLCLPEYTRFKANLKIAEEDLLIEVIDEKYVITSITSLPKMSSFESTDEKCNLCQEKIAFMCQCPHEIKLRGGFCKTDFMEMHMRRDRVTGSLSGWTRSTNFTSSELLSIDAEDIDSDGINFTDCLIGNPDDDDCIIGNPDDVSVVANDDMEEFEMNTGIAAENAEHVFDLSKGWVKSLDNRTLRTILNDVSTYYEKADRKVQLIVGAMSIQMRNLLQQGRKKADSTTFDPSERGGKSLEKTMEDIVETYQSSFSSNSSFATNLTTKMTVRQPTQAILAAAGKQRFKRRKENDSISAMKKANLRTVSVVQNIDIPMEQRKNPPEVQAPFTGIVMGVNETKKRAEAKCGFCNQAAGHKIDRCPLRQEFKRKGVEYTLSNTAESNAVVTLIENGMNVAGFFGCTQADKYFNDLQNSWFRMHVILHKLYLPEQLSQQKRSMINLFFEISLVNSNGMIDSTTDHVLVSGRTMNKILMTVGKKKKFLYDWTGQEN